MHQSRFALVHLAPLCLTACILPASTPATSPLRPPRPGDRFDFPVPAPDENRTGVVEAASGTREFEVGPIVAGPPALRLEFDPDCGGTVGVPFPLALHVVNDGPGTAHELILLAALPTDLSGPEDRAILELLSPELGPGESVSLRAPLVAHRAGVFSVDALASSTNGPIVGPLRAEVLVRDVPPRSDVDEVARRTELTAILASVAQAEPEVEHGAEPGPRLDPPSTSRPEPAVDGSAEPALAPDALGLRVAAPGDFVFVGDLTDYTVRVTNTGADARRGLALSAVLEDGLDLVSISGATDTGFGENQLRSLPLASLAPGESAEWRLVARSYRPGDGRLRFTVTYDDGSMSEETVTTSFREWGQ